MSGRVHNRDARRLMHYILWAVAADARCPGWTLAGSCLAALSRVVRILLGLGQQVEGVPNDAHTSGCMAAPGWGAPSTHCP